MIESPLALAAVIAAVHGPSPSGWTTDSPRLGKVGASMIAIIFGAILSNTEHRARLDSIVYDVVLGPVTSVSIAWLLLSVDLRDLAKAGPRMTGAFAGRRDRHGTRGLRGHRALPIPLRRRHLAHRGGADGDIFGRLGEFRLGGPRSGPRRVPSSPG